MPVYFYNCPNCGDMELEHSMKAEKPNCPNCAGEISKRFYPTNAVFKGTGFYTTDKKLRHM